MTTMGRACCSVGCRLPVCTPSLPCRPPKYSLTLCSLLLPCRALAVKSLITKMLNQQPRMRVNALFNYLVEMHSVSPSLKQQVRNFVHNHRNRYMSLALGYALKLKMNALLKLNA